MKIKIKTSNIVWYIALLPFLFPAGFAEYFPSYKNFRVTILGIATVIIIAREIYLLARKRGKMAISMPLISVILYHVALLVITLSAQGTITQGLQKIFIAPALCILMDEGCRTNLKDVINVICNLLILVCVLNIFVFNQWMFPEYFLVSNHIIFIGHVQIASEIGIFGILAAFIEYSNGIHKYKSIVLTALSLLTMLYSGTVASYIGIGIIAVSYLLKNIRSFKRFICNHECMLFILLCIVSAVIINTPRIRPFKKYSAIITALSNGRTFIWEQGLNLFSKKPLFGYGAYGVLIKVFWSAWSDNKLGFNYAHSTLLQLLLDGGIVLTAIFFISIILYIKSEDCNLKNADVKYFSHILLLTFFTIGIFESITEYYYLFMLLSVLPYLYKVEGTSSKTIKTYILESH